MAVDGHVGCSLFAVNVLDPFSDGCILRIRRIGCGSGSGGGLDIGALVFRVLVLCVARVAVVCVFQLAPLVLLDLGLHQDVPSCIELVNGLREWADYT